MNHLPFIASICLLLFAIQAQAQSYSTINYTIADGLPSNQVYSMYQDQQGYLWIATNAGLSRFDGKKFENFTRRDGLDTYAINSMYQDAQGNIWLESRRNDQLQVYNGRKFRTIPKDSISIFCTNSTDWQASQFEAIWLQKQDGIHLVHPKKAQHLPIKKLDYLEHNWVYDLHVIDKQYWYLGTSLGFIIYDNGMYTNLTTNMGRTTQIHHIIPYNDVFWLQTDEGMQVFDPCDNSFSQQIFPTALHRNVIQSVVFDKRGHAWLGTINGLYKYDGVTFSHYTTADGLLSNRISQLFVASDNTLWISTASGMTVYRNERFVTIEDVNKGKAEGNQYYYSTHILEDHEGNIWFDGTEGIKKCTGFHFLNYSIDDPLSYKDASCVLVDKQNRTWIGHYDHGLNSYKNGEQTSYILSHNNVVDSSIYTIVQAPNDSIYVGTETGLWVFNKQQFDFIKLAHETTKKATIKRIRAILPDKQGGMWVLGYQHLHYYTPQYCKSYFIDDLLKPNGNGMIYTSENGDYFLTAYIDREGVLWTSTFNGLYRFSEHNDNKHFELVGSHNYLGRVTTIEQDKDGYYWLIGRPLQQINRTLIRFDGKYMISFDERDGLSNSILYKLCIQNGYLWLNTANGIERVDIERYNQLKNFSSINLNYNDGFTPIAGNWLCTTDNKGNIWFGHNEGVMRYSPYSHIQHTDTNKLHIARIRLNFEEVDWLAYSDQLDSVTKLPENLQLQTHENTLTFNLKNIHFSDRQHQRYQYHLEGFEQDWQTPTQQSHITYSNLAAGTYTFKARLLHHDRVVENSTTTFCFNIDVSLWQKTWFWAFIVLVSMLALSTLTLTYKILQWWQKRRLASQLLGLE